MTPDDSLDELEWRVRRRPTPALPPGLRQRVLEETTAIMARSPIVEWRVAAGLAAAVLVALNVAAITSDHVAGPVVPRMFPPPGVSVASTDSATVVPRLGCPWLPCDLPGGR